MISREFVIERHPDFGDLGFRPRFMDDGDAYGPMALAHDVLEHTPEACREGGAEGEFMAVGAMVYIRVEGSYWIRFSPYNLNKAEVHCAADFPEIFRKIEAGDQTLEHPGVTQKLGEQDEIFREIIRIGLKNCRADGTPYPRGATDKLLGWMRRGYRSAARRYRGHEPYDVCSRFWDLEKQATQLLKHVEFEGAFVRATVDLASGRTWVREIKTNDY